MRYQIVHESMSSHGCCFDVTIIDTTIKPEYPLSRSVCECMDIEMAQKIVDLLNRDDSSEKEGVMQKTT